MPIFFDDFLERMMNGAVDVSTGTFRVGLIDTGVAAQGDVHQSDMTSGAITHSGDAFLTGITNVAGTIDTVMDVVFTDAATGLGTTTAKHAVLYEDHSATTGDAAETNALMVVYDGATVTPNGATITMQVNALGLMHMTTG